jgi:2-C-methyl-D-erythritol 4-phosphate cytidylyltransferase
MNLPQAFALIPAAGMGKRMGAAINKQYLQLGGMPIVARTISIFELAPCIAGIYLVIPSEEIPYCREHVVAAYGFRKVREIVPGGRERQNSVMNGLNAMGGELSRDDVVLIHDGVRPFITAGLLQQAIAAACSGDGALVAVPAKDTIKRVSNGVVTATLERDLLWQAQTPQAFRFGIIQSAHQAAERDGFLGTDDTSLVERQGGVIRVVPGDYRNIKITTPEDLILAEAFLAGCRKEPET